MSKANRLALLVLVVFSVAAFAAAQSYTVTDLGGGQAFAINSLGDVVERDNYNSSFIWSPGGSLLTLAPLTAGMATNPYGINSQGLAVGLSATGQGYSAVLWTNGEAQYLGMLPGGRACSGTGINASEEVSGYCYIPTGAEAFLWTKATGMQGIGFLPGAAFSFAQAINRFGQVAGYSGASNNLDKDYAFIWSKTTGMKNLGKLPGYDGSAAYGINDLGQAVGASLCKPFSCPAHATLWSKTKGSMLDLGVPPGANSSFAFSINNVGQVVGVSSDIGHAFVWSPSTGMLDLNTLIPANSGWVLILATAINDQGQIVGYGMHNCCVTEAFLLTPQ
jgi:probable HAF family extracellular repeat protein